MNIHHLKQIETPRLIIRPVRLGDEVEISQAIHRSLPELQRWMVWAKDPSFETTQSAVKRFDQEWQSGKSHHFMMVVVHQQDQKIIAASGFNDKSDLAKHHFEIGYWIDSSYSGQGYVTEYVTALTRFAFLALNAVRVQITTQVGNHKSLAVAKRCGFVVESILKHYCIDCVSNQPSDSFMLACYDIATVPPLKVTWQFEPKES